MTDTTDGDVGGKQRSSIATMVLICGGAVVLILGVIAIAVNPGTNAMSIFNSVLPVIATWVGTVIAFYFGRENFETASRQTLAATKQASSTEDVGNKPVESLMIPLKEMVCYPIPQGKLDKDVLLTDLKLLFKNNVSRLPILDDQKVPKYMIHQSRIDNFNAEPGKPKATDTLDDFITYEKGKNREYGKDNGFVLVSRQTLMAVAKKQMDTSGNCQDIFVTENGKDNEPLIGWISNGKLSQYLES